MPDARFLPFQGLEVGIRRCLVHTRIAVCMFTDCVSSQFTSVNCVSKVRLKISCERDCLFVDQETGK